MSGWAGLLSRLSGKWQLPLLAASMITLAAAVTVLRPNPGRMPLARAADTVLMLREAGDFDRAAEIAEAVLGREDCAGAERGAFHLELARSRFAAAERDDLRTVHSAKLIVHHFRQAGTLGQSFTAEDFVGLGQALEWSEQFALSVDAYREALSRDYAHAAVLRKHLIGLLRDELEATPESLDAELDTLLGQIPADRHDLLLWAAEEKVSVLEELDRLSDAAELVTRIGEQLTEPNDAAEVDYLRGLLLHKAGRQAEAEVHVRALRNRLTVEDPVSPKAGWLLGRILLAQETDEAASEALSFFRGVISTGEKGAFAAASMLGMAEALARLGKHDDAAEAYGNALADTKELRRNRFIDEEAVRVSLTVLAEMERQEGRLPSALRYAELATTLTTTSDAERTVLQLQQLAGIQAAYGEELRRRAAQGGGEYDPAVPDWRELFAAGAANHRRIAELSVHDERLAAEAAWLSAELHAKAGRREQAIALYDEFANQRPLNSLVPRALLRIGQLHQAAGRFETAVICYQECHRRFPNLLDGIRTLVPMAQCYAALGPDRLELAEKTLRIVLEGSEVFTPEAPEFADALFLLGDVLSRREQFEQAISTLHEALDRYPRDGRVWRARFLLADCYRRSAMMLKAEASAARFEAEIEQIRAESRARLAAARELYRLLVDEYETRDAAGLTLLERIYLRHAYLYEADCHFESGEYQEAVRLYEQAAGLLSDSPSSLTAFMQMIHCHVFLGQARHARTALARARVVLERMDTEAFAGGVSPESKADWKQYLDWLGDSELF